MNVETMVVSMTLPTELVRKIDKKVNRKFQPRAEWLRDAVLKAAEMDGLISIEQETNQSDCSPDLSKAAA